MLEVSSTARKRQPSSSATDGRSRRTITRVACESCRKRKLRCDSARPTCTACQSAARHCSYDTLSNDETRAAALRREQQTLARENAILRAENERMRSLLATDQVAHAHGLTCPTTALVPSESLYATTGSPLGMVTAPMDPAPMMHFGSAHLHQVRYAPAGQWAQSVQSPYVNDVPANGTAGGPDDTFPLDSWVNGSLAMHAPSSNEPFAGMHVPDNRYEQTVPYYHLEATTSTGSGASFASHASITVPTSIEDQFRLLDASFNRQCWLTNHPSDSLNRRNKLSEASDEPAWVVAAGSSVHQIFGNLTLRSAIGANHHLPEIQQRQYRNIHVPIWAMQSMALREDDDPFDAMYVMLQQKIDEGSDLEFIIENAPCLEALDDQAALEKASLLSRLLVGMVSSIKSGEAITSVTQYCIMWLHWNLWRWILVPTLENYHAVPPMLRPNPSQIFAPHSRVFDFVFSPALRDYICQSRNVDARWLTAACATVRIEWPADSQESHLVRNPSTNKLEVSESCKRFAEQPASWSLGPKIREYLRNADYFFRIQKEASAIS